MNGRARGKRVSVVARAFLFRKAQVLGGECVPYMCACVLGKQMAEASTVIEVGLEAIELTGVERPVTRMSEINMAPSPKRLGIADLEQLNRKEMAVRRKLHSRVGCV